MFRLRTTKGAVALAILASPFGAAVANADGPGTTNAATPPSLPDSVPDSTTPGGPDSSEGSDGNDAGGAPIDIEFQIDLMLGLVPDDEMEQYFKEQNAEQQKRVQECMNDAGFEYNIDTGTSPMMVAIGPGSGEDQLEWAQQWGFGFWTSLDPESSPFGTSNAGDWEDPNAFVEELPEGERNAWHETSQQCWETTFEGEPDPFRNPMVQQAMEDFQTSVENDPAMRDAEQAWRDCMNEAGQPFADEDEMYDSVYGEDADYSLHNQFYESEAWKPDSPDYEQWRGLVDNEIAVAVAGAECGPALSEAREEVQRRLRPDLVEAWQDVDWDLPPSSIPGGGMVVEAGSATASPVGGEAPEDSAPDGTGGAEAPDPLDLSGATTTTIG